MIIKINIMIITTTIMMMMIIVMIIIIIVIIIMILKLQTVGLAHVITFYQTFFFLSNLRMHLTMSISGHKWSDPGPTFVRHFELPCHGKKMRFLSLVKTLH